MKGVHTRHMACAALAAAGLALPNWAGDRVAFSDIRRARWSDGATWYLALGAPSDGAVLTRECDIALAPGQASALIDVPEGFSGKDFTVRLNLTDVTGASLRIGSPKVPGHVRTALVSRDGWVSLCFGPTAWEGTLPIEARATARLRIVQVTVYRRFGQLYGTAGRVGLVGAAYHKLGAEDVLSYPLLPGSYLEQRTGRWHRPAPGSEDGIPGATLTKSYQNFLNGPLQAESGLPVPVRAAGGLILCARIKGRFAIITYPERAKYILTWAGAEGEWSTPGIRLDASVMDGDGNGTYTGLKKVEWASAKTWADNYGAGFVDFAAMLPQIEIPTQQGRTGKLLLEYRSVSGLKTLTVNTPGEAQAVALVHSGDRRTDVLLRSRGQYARLTTVEDSFHPDCLAVQAGSIRFEP